MKSILLRACVGALALTAGAVHAADSYRVVAAFEVLFDTEGRLARLTPHEEEAHSAAFWEGVKKRVQNLKITAPRDAAGQPATLATGLYIRLDVTKGDNGGQVQIAGIDLQPLVIKREYAGYPEDIGRSAGWTGDVDAQCLVGTNGRCGEVKVKALPGMPPSLLRWAEATLGLWEFKPPRLNDVPFAVPVSQSFSLTTPDTAPVNFLNRGAGRL